VVGNRTQVDSGVRKMGGYASVAAHAIIMIARSAGKTG